MSECQKEEKSADFIKGVEAMREICLAIVRPLGSYSDTPEMQAILQLRLDLERLICSVPAGLEKGDS